MPQITIEKFVFGGQAMGRLNNPNTPGAPSKIAFIWGALPGETVEFLVTRKKKNFIEGVVTKIITASPDRVEPKEKHYLSCSPWQTLTLEKELFWKKEIALETYRRVGGIELSDIELVTVGEEYHYRNKIEYSFALDSEGHVVLSFFERGQHYRAPIEQCELASQSINDLAQKILAWVRAQNIPIRSLKSLIIRSNKAGETIAALFIKDRLELAPPIFEKPCSGFHIYYSDHRSPASIISDTLYTTGNSFITESIGGVQLRYGLNSFFQINTPIFEEALSDITRFATGTQCVDFYSGVGSIGLPLAKAGKKMTLVEINSEAVQFAKDNIALNGLKNVEAVLSPAENSLEFIKEGETVIVDPPRLGLDKQVVQAILDARPSRVIYLSCDLATQARDLALLKEAYKPIFWRLYNFFPRTPHIEGLVVLDRA